MSISNRIVEFVCGMIIRGMIATFLGFVLEIVFTFFGTIFFGSVVGDLLHGTDKRGFYSIIVFHLIGWALSFSIMRDLMDSDVEIPTHTVTIDDGKHTMIARVYTK